MDNMISISPLIEKLNSHITEIKKLYKLLHELKEATGASFEIPTLSLDDDFIDSSRLTIGIGSVGQLKPDQFYGKSNTIAAEEYIKMVGHSVSLDEIFDSLQKGGIQFSGKDPKKALYVSLIRAHKKFVKVGEGKNVTWGLIEFYPDVIRKKNDSKMDNGEINNGEEIDSGAEMIDQEEGFVNNMKHQEDDRQ